VYSANSVDHITTAQLIFFFTHNIDQQKNGMPSVGTTPMDPSKPALWLKEYHEQGFVILKGVIPEETVENVKGACTLLVDQLAERLVRAVCGA
jgi:hypothetical protein